MGRVGEGEKKRKKESAEFKSINFMREALNMPLLEKGWVRCISDCGDDFFSFDVKGNRMCEVCKCKPRVNSFQDFNDAYSIVGA